jgi:hypothetical protein
VTTNERSFKWATVNHVRASCNADGAVLLDIDKGLCYSLNAVGGRIWQAIEAGNGESSIDEIIEAVAQEFPEVPRAQLLIDIDGCLRELEDKALIAADGRRPASAAGKPVSRRRKFFPHWGKS